MQDRYAGDIGDFAKFAILRRLIHGTSLRIGLVWFLTEQRTDPSGDGRHIAYLARNPRNNELYRSCDVDLYDQIKGIAEAPIRSVAAYESTTILPRDAVYFGEPLIFDDADSRSERSLLRSGWAQRAVDSTRDCDLIMFDPDNGLEVKSATKTSQRGTKYTFLDELSPYAERNQSMVIYQHATRSGTLAEQVTARLQQLSERVRLSSEPFGIVWRSISPRAFLVAPAAEHAEELRAQTDRLVSGPLANHVYLIRSSPTVSSSSRG